MSTTEIAATPRRSVGDAMAARLRDTSIVVVGCGIAGALVGGLGSRLVMRLSALAAPEARGALTEAGNVVGEITFAGTLELILFAGAASAVFGAGAMTVLRPWLPGETLARGLVFGAFLLALMGGAVVDPSNADFTILGHRLLNVAMLSALFIAFGLLAAGGVALLGSRLPPAAALSPRIWLVTVLCALPVVPGIAGVAFGFAPELGIPLVASSVAMGASASIDRGGRHGLASVMRATATAVMLAVVVIAGAGYVDGVLTIL
jgi:hypothetical protein